MRRMEWKLNRLLTKRLSSLFALLIGISCVAAPNPVWSQDQTLEQLQQQWSELEQQFSEKQAVLETGDGDLKDVRDEYRGLLEQADQIIKQIKSSAWELLVKNPQDKAALRALLGTLLNDADRGRDKEVLSMGDRLIELGLNPLYFETAAKADRLTIKAREIFEELLIRQRETVADDLPRVKLTTTEGDIVLELYENQAPQTVGNFISLVESGYYTDMLFHRVLEGFMAQTGDKRADGSGSDGPGYRIKCECYTPEARPHFSNCVSMALSGKDTGGSQFFLTFARTSHLDGQHTCFGRVISGSEVLDKIERTHLSINGQEEPIPNIEKDKIVKAEVIRKRDHDYRPVKVGDETVDKEIPPATPPADPNLSSSKAATSETESPEANESP